MNNWLIILIAAWLAPGFLVFGLLLWFSRRRRRPANQTSDHNVPGQSQQQGEDVAGSGIDPRRKEGAFD